MLPHWRIKALLESTLSCAYFHVWNEFHTNQSLNFIQIKVYKALSCWMWSCSDGWEHRMLQARDNWKHWGGESLSSCKHTHTPLEDNKSSKNNGEDPSCRPLSAPIDVNVERSPRHITSVSSSWAWHLNTPLQAQLQLHHSKHAAESAMLLNS